MKQIGSAITGLGKPEAKPQSSTGKPHGETGSQATSALSPVKPSRPPTLAEAKASLTILTESHTSLTLVHSRIPAEGNPHKFAGTNVTERRHVLNIPMDEAKVKLSTLMGMSLPAQSSETSEVLKRLFTLPSNKADAEHTSQVWLTLLSGQPIASIVYAFNKFIRDPSREFRPAPGVFLACVEEHAARIRLKAKVLQEAIEVAS